MEQKSLYSTLRIRYNDELKLFPSIKLVSLQDVKLKAITRFDLQIKQSQFDLEYFDWESQGVLSLENLPGTHQIDQKILNKLIKEKIQLQIVKKQLNCQNEILKKSKNAMKQKPNLSEAKQLSDKQNKYIQLQKVQKHYAQCDECMKFPILGIRYKCIICQDYDLCQKCYNQKQGQKGSKLHPYIKIRTHIQRIEKIKVDFNKANFDKMQECKKGREESKNIEKDFSHLQIDQSCLPRRTLVSKNFVQQLIGQNHAKKIYKTHPSLEGTYGQILTIDQSS